MFITVPLYIADNTHLHAGCLALLFPSLVAPATFCSFFQLSSLHCMIRKISSTKSESDCGYLFITSLESLRVAQEANTAWLLLSTCKSWSKN